MSKVRAVYDLDSLARENNMNLRYSLCIANRILKASFNAATDWSPNEPDYIIDVVKENNQLSEMLIDKLRAIEKGLGIDNYYQTTDFFECQHG